MKNTIRTFALLAASAFSTSAMADVTLPKLFTDHMVLQRESKIPVWGKADAGENVSVTLAGQTQSTTADQQGKWRIVLDAVKSDQPLEMRVKGNNTLAIHDVLIGEVWVCSGQSNMEWPVRMARDPEAEAAAANWPHIRFFNVSVKKTPAR